MRALDYKYRPDVDGLRAVAIILVLLFHADLGVKGGFIGVDVFFVISGFLITGLILKEQQNGEFSLARFWVRRVRRIFPASAVMVAAALAAGFFLLLPSDYRDLSESAIAQQLILSNIYFWRNTGYFDGAAECQPLLHTWSLAVEEQFYIGYPILLMLLNRYGRNATLIALVLLGIASLVLSEYGARFHRSATFFLLPTRAWELITGGLVCFLPPPTRFSLCLRTTISWLSLALIVAVGWLYDSNTPFPGLYALAPCTATASIIYFNSNHLSLPALILSKKPFVFTGLISYSLYLWHWPILAFYRYWQGPDFDILEALLLLSFAGFISVLSWLFIEQPFRRIPITGPKRQIFLQYGFAAFIILAGAAFISVRNGIPTRVSKELAEFDDIRDSRKFIHEFTIRQAIRAELPLMGDVYASRSCLLWGDSHAMALAPGLDAACKELAIRAFQSTRSSMPPIIDLELYRGGVSLKVLAHNSAVLQFIRDNEIEVVFLAAAWSTYAKHSDFEEKLRKTISEITQMKIHVAVLLDVASHSVDVPKHFAQAKFWGLSSEYKGVLLEQHRAQNQIAEDAIRRACIGNPLATILDPAGLFVDRDGFLQASIDGELMYRDGSHLSVEGGLRTKALFQHYFEASRVND
jgi:peptidoglycan/LPS O-acetylase OafA/YrhL